MQINHTSVKIKAYLSKVGFKNINDLNISRKRNLIAIFNYKSKFYILKQKGTSNTLFNNLSIENEILFLENSNKNIEFKNLSFLPKIYHSNLSKNILISKFYKRHKPLIDFKPDHNLFKEIGKKVGDFHKLDYNTFKKNHKTIDKSNLLFNFEWLTPSTITNGGPSIVEYIKLIQKFPDLLQSVNHLYSTYENNCVIHGDIKTDNILVFKKKDNYYLKFIDFEFTSLGDRHYDLGYILGSFLMNWIFGMKLKNEKMDFNNQYFEDLKNAYRVLIDTYEKTTFCKPNYHLIIKYAGLFLLKTFYNCSIQSREFGKNEIMLLQIARNYLVFSEQQTSIHFYDK